MVCVCQCVKLRRVYSFGQPLQARGYRTTCNVKLVWKLSLELRTCKVKLAIQAAGGFLRLQVLPGKQPGSSLGQSLSKDQNASLPAPEFRRFALTQTQSLEAQLGQAWSLAWLQFVCQHSRSSCNTLSNEGPLLGTGSSPFLNIIFWGSKSRQIAWSLEWTSHRWSPAEKWNCFNLHTILDLDHYLNQFARNDPQCTKEI